MVYDIKGARSSAYEVLLCNSLHCLVVFIYGLLGPTHVHLYVYLVILWANFEGHIEDCKSY